MEEDIEILGKYGQMMQKHGLPEYDKINHIFEIGSVDANEFVLRGIRRRMIEKVNDIIEVLEELLHPNTTVSAMHECQYFSDSDKMRISNLYSTLMGLVRESDLLELVQEDEKDAAFVKSLFADWDGIRAELLTIFSKLKVCWTEKEMSDKSILGYFG